MIVFLTSSPDGDLGSDNGGSPYGYDDRNGFASRLRECLTEPTFFTMFAADPEDHRGSQECCDYFAGVFERTGIHLRGHAVCDSRNAYAAGELLARSGVIMLAGGHVPTQNAFFQRIGLRDLMKDYQGVVIGVSAGSMNSADVVYAQPELPGESLDPHYVRFLSGLNLTSLQILPHYNLTKDRMKDGQRLVQDIAAKDSAGHCFYLLRDGSYVLIRGGETLICGEALTLCNGVLEKYCDYGQVRIIHHKE